MSGRFVFLVFVSVALTACPGGRDGEFGGGRLIIERTSPDPASLVDADATARYCERDSVLTIISIGSRWSAVIGMRTTWPPIRQFTADTAVGGIGTAAVAARIVNDSASPAFISRSGTLELDSADVLSGRFTVETGRDSGVVSLSGRFQGLRRDSTGCAAP